MSEVLDLLASELDQRKIREIAAHLNADEFETEAAIAAALPTLVSALGRHTETEHGAQMVAHQMQGIGGGSLGDLLGGILSGSRSSDSSKPTKLPSPKTSSSVEDILPPGFDSPSPAYQRSEQLGPTGLPKQQKSSRLDSALGPGNELPSGNSYSPVPTDPSDFSSNSMDDVLGKALGGKQKRVEESIGRSSGLDLKKIGPLLAILAPLILGAMRSRASARPSGNTRGINPADLSEMMRNERSSIEKRPGGSMIGKMLDQDGDGDFDLSDIVKLGMKFFFSRR